MRAFRLRTKAERLWAKATAKDPQAADRVRRKYVAPTPEPKPVVTAVKPEPKPVATATAPEPVKAVEAVDATEGPDLYKGVPRDDDSRRTVVLKTSPLLAPTLQQLQEHLGAISCLRLVRRDRKFTGIAFLQYATEAAAKAAAAKGTFTLGSYQCYVSRARPRVGGLEGLMQRSVKLVHLPLDVKDDDIHEAFPDVHTINYRGSGPYFRGTAFVRFGAVSSAEQALEMGSVRIRDADVPVLRIR